MAKTQRVSLVVGALLAGAAIAACGSVSSGPGDAGAGPVVDAPPGGGNPDARPGDVDGGAGIDSGVPDPRGTVHVTVVDPSGSGVPAVGVTVVFLDPDGSVVKTASTDSAGKTSAEVLPGASVTTVIPAASSFRLRTMLAVKPGDDLVIGPKVIDTQTTGTFTLTWPDAPTHATTFSVYGPCGFVGLTTFDPTGPSPTAPTTLTFGVQNGCRPATGEFLIWARGQQGISLFFNDSANVPFAPGGSFAVSSQWNNGSFAATYTNLAMVSTVSADRIVPDGGRSSPVTTPASDPFSISLPGPVGVTARMVSKFNTTAGSVQTVRQKLPGASTTYALNVNQTLLAWLNTPTFDVATQQVHLVEIAPTPAGSPAPDLLRITATWQRLSTSYTWEVFGPEATTVKLPPLPAAAGAGLNPTVMDVLQLVATSYEADTVTGYDDVRGNAGAAITDVFEAPRSPATLIRVSASPPPPPVINRR